MNLLRSSSAALPLLALACGLVLLNVWLQTAGYVSQAAVADSARALLMLGAEEGERGRMALLHPQLTLFLLMPLYFLWPGLNLYPAYLLGAVFASLLLVLFYRRLRRSTSRPAAVVLTLCFALNPLLLWSATSGGSVALCLLLYFLVCLAVLELQQSQGALNYMILGVAVALLGTVDIRGLYIAVAFLPLLPLAVPPKVLEETTLGTVLIVYAPLLLLLLAWVYLVSIYTSDPIAGVLASAIQGRTGVGQGNVESAWLMRHGGEWLQPLGIAGLIVFVAFPVCMWFGIRLLRRNRPDNTAAALIVLLMPLIATTLATANQFLRHPLHMLFFELAAVMALVTVPEMRTRRLRWLIVLLLGGNLAVVPWMVWLSDSGLAHWWRTSAGVQATQDHQMVELARWTRNLDGLMVDDHLGYELIAHRGTADNLIVPATADYQKTISSGSLEVSWIAVPNPRSPEGARDGVNFRFPRLYDYGHPGYVLAYDDGSWRVYGHEPLPPGFEPVRLEPATLDPASARTVAGE